MKNKLLAIDLGNTTLTLGLFDNEKLRAHWRLATDHNRLQDEYGIQFMEIFRNFQIDPNQITGIVFSSVVPPLSERVIQACLKYLKQKPLCVHHKLKLNIKIRYDNPASVGTDRIADAVAAKSLYGSPLCVIDFGTATTFNAINKKGEYLGGAILPGIGLSARALYENTAKLPPVELSAPPSVIGANTIHAIQSGIIFGYVALVKGMVQEFKQQLGKDTQIVATGGHVLKISPYTPSIDHVDPWLTLTGLRLIWEMNQ